jgi:D-amino-acid dehydrogenase
VSTLIIGGGLLGLSTAMALLERGEKVRVLEGRADVGLETSFANGGLLTPSMPEPWNGPGVFGQLAASLFDNHSAMKLRLRAVPALLPWGLRFLRNSSPERYRQACRQNFELARYSMSEYQKLAARLSFDFDAANRGVLAVFRSDRAMQARLAVSTQLAEAGMRFSVLDAEAAVATEPALTGVRKSIAAAIHFHDDASGDAHLFCQGLKNALLESGAVLDFNQSILGLKVKNRRICAVETAEEIIPAERVVIAAGVHSAALLKSVDVSVSVQPVKGYSVTLPLPQAVQGPRIPILDDAMHAVVTPLGNRLRAVGTAEFNGFDTSIVRGRIDNLMRVLQSLLPDIDAHLDHALAVPWAGLRPMSSDGKPYIGSTAVDGLFVNTGHGQLGWTMATGSAQLLADLMCGTPTAVDPAPFRVGR